MLDFSKFATAGRDGNVRIYDSNKKQTEPTLMKEVKRDELQPGKRVYSLRFSRENPNFSSHISPSCFFTTARYTIPTSTSIQTIGLFPHVPYVGANRQ